MFTSKTQAILIGFLIGAAGLGYGIYLYFETQAFFKRAKETTAYVTNVSTRTVSESKNGSKEYKEKTKVSYEYTVDGKTYSDSDEESGGTNYVKGEGFKVFYDPQNPVDNRTKREADWMPWLFIAIGAVCFGGGIHFFMKKPQHQKKNARA